jgi:epoxyqueuosine reductase
MRSEGFSMDASFIRDLVAGAARTVSVERLDDLREGIEAKERDGLLHEQLRRHHLSALRFTPPEELPGARSLVVIATPQPQARFAFEWRGRMTAIVVPPTYLHAREVEDRVRKLLADALAPMGYRVAPSSVPKKLLAVRSGLARYGRNNITYIPGMGSFHRLSAFFSDMACDDGDWEEPRMLERCEDCRACVRACPSGAILEERFLLRAERCIVLHNEMPPEIPFPSWLDSSWHNCLVGCMACQRACPEDRPFAGWFEDGPRFTEEETWLLLKGTTLDELPPATATKLRDCDLADMLDIFPRNLAPLLGGAR